MAMPALLAVAATLRKKIERERRKKDRTFASDPYVERDAVAVPSTLQLVSIIIVKEGVGEKKTKNKASEEIFPLLFSCCVFVFLSL